MTAAIFAGMVLPEIVRTVSPEEVDRYAAASGDTNPIHLDEDFARNNGLPGRIVHGLFTLGIVGCAVENWCGDAYELTGLSTRFSSPLPVGEEITVSGTVSEHDGAITIGCSVSSKRGERVLSHCLARVRPRRIPEGE